MLSKGVRHMLLSTFFFSLMNVCVKEVSHIPAVEIILFRSGISLVMSWAMLKRQNVSVLGTHHGLLIARGVAGAAALILFFITLQNIPLATAVTIQYLSPIFTTILGIFIVKEKVKPWQWVFFLISFAGILVIEGVDVRISPLYLGLGVASALFAGIAYNMIRRLNTREHPLVIVFYFPLVALPITGLYSIFNWVQPVGWDWPILILVGVLTQLAQLPQKPTCFTPALHYEKDIAHGKPAAIKAGKATLLHINNAIYTSNAKRSGLCLYFILHKV